MRFTPKSIPFEIILLLVWILVVLVINPLGEFPVNDDWAYSKNVWFLSEEGRFVFSDWPGMTLISQTLTGALFTTLFGFSFSVLRLATLLFGISFLLLLYTFLRKLKVERNTAAFTSLLILFSPFFLSLSFTFMTEIYFLFFFLVTLMLYHQYLLRDKLIFLLLSSLFALITTLTRQTGLIIPIAIGMVEIIRSGRNIKKIVWSLLPFTIVFMGLRVYSHWLESTGNLPENYGRPGDLLETLRFNNLDYFMCKAGTILMYLGLFLLPLSLRMIPSKVSPGTKFRRNLLVLALILVSILVVMGFKGFPAPNVFYNIGLGPKLLKDSYWGDNISPVLPLAVWTGIKVLAVGGVFTLALVMFYRPINLTNLYNRIQSGTGTSIKFLLLLICAGYLVYMLINKFFFDRYTLSLTIFSAIFLAAMIKTTAGKWTWISGGFLGLFMLFSGSAVRDFMEWNRARWRGLEYLVQEQQIDVKRIDGGLEFNAWYEAGPFNPADKMGKSWWFVTEDEYVLACGPIEGFQYHVSFPYTRWLFHGKDSVQILWHPIEGMLPYAIYPVTCDCETLADNPSYLLSQQDSIRFEGGTLRSADHARSGRYSVKLDEENHFTFLHRFKDVRAGEKFRVRVWKYGGNDQIIIVAGGGDGCHSENQSEASAVDESGWELLELTTVVPDGFACYRYGIYLWNAGDGEAWLDDLEITRNYE